MEWKGEQKSASEREKNCGRCLSFFYNGMFFHSFDLLPPDYFALTHSAPGFLSLPFHLRSSQPHQLLFYGTQLFVQFFSPSIFPKNNSRFHGCKLMSHWRSIKAYIQFVRKDNKLNGLLKHYFLKRKTNCEKKFILRGSPEIFQQGRFLFRSVCDILQEKI